MPSSKFQVAAYYFYSISFYVNCLSIGRKTQLDSLKKKQKINSVTLYTRLHVMLVDPKKKKKITQHVAEQVFSRTVVLRRQNVKRRNAFILSLAGSFFHPFPFGTGCLYYI